MWNSQSGVQELLSSLSCGKVNVVRNLNSKTVILNGYET